MAFNRTTAVGIRAVSRGRPQTTTVRLRWFRRRSDVGPAPIPEQQRTKTILLIDILLALPVPLQAPAGASLFHVSSQMCDKSAVAYRSVYIRSSSTRPKYTSSYWCATESRIQSRALGLEDLSIRPLPFLFVAGDGDAYSDAIAFNHTYPSP